MSPIEQELNNGSSSGFQDVAGSSRDIHDRNDVGNDTVSEAELSNLSNLTNCSSIAFEMSSGTANAMLPILQQIEEEEAEERRKAAQ